jgi:hypothetical protein
LISISHGDIFPSFQPFNPKGRKGPAIFPASQATPSRAFQALKLAQGFAQISGVDLRKAPEIASW